MEVVWTDGGSVRLEESATLHYQADSAWTIPRTPPSRETNRPSRRSFRSDEKKRRGNGGKEPPPQRRLRNKVRSLGRVYIDEEVDSHVSGITCDVDAFPQEPQQVDGDISGGVTESLTASSSKDASLDEAREERDEVYEEEDDEEETQEEQEKDGDESTQVFVNMFMTSNGSNEPDSIGDREAPDAEFVGESTDTTDDIIEQIRRETRDALGSGFPRSRFTSLAAKSGDSCQSSSPRDRDVRRQPSWNATPAYSPWAFDEIDELVRQTDERSKSKDKNLKGSSRASPSHKERSRKDDVIQEEDEESYLPDEVKKELRKGDRRSVEKTTDTRLENKENLGQPVSPANTAQLDTPEESAGQRVVYSSSPRHDQSQSNSTLRKVHKTTQSQTERQVTQAHNKTSRKSKSSSQTARITHLT